MQTGEVDWFYEERGFGFIKSNGKPIYVHYTELIGCATLAKGDHVQFKVEDGIRGPKAVDVKKLH